MIDKLEEFEELKHFYLLNKDLSDFNDRWPFFVYAVKFRPFVSKKKKAEIKAMISEQLFALTPPGTSVVGLQYKVFFSLQANLNKKIGRVTGSQLI